ncbi:MAG: hypothetical protein WBD63_04945 [Phycisphaerae bacterium]|nr:hypothetical protein [Phycisphaerae bacterium]
MEQAAVVALVAVWLLVMISGSAGAAQEPRRRTPEETARYEAGLRAARKFLESWEKEMARKQPPMYYLEVESRLRGEFLESLRHSGEESAEAVEYVALVEWPRKKHVVPVQFWTTYALYLDARAGDWGRPRLNRLLGSDKLTRMERAAIMGEFIEIYIEPANWLDEAVVLPIIQSFLKNTEYYGFMVGAAGGKHLEPVRLRFCDLGVRAVAGLYHPAEVKWIDIGTRLPKEEADRQRDANVEAAKAWVQVRLARAALRPQLLQMVSSYWHYRLTRGQIETLLDLWAALESRNPAGNIRDVRALADMLIADLRRTADAERDALEKEFHRLVQDRLAGMLAKAGYHPEGPATRLPRNHVDQREWLRNAVHHLARARGGAPPDQWMRYEWERYLDELRDAAQADRKAAETPPGG